MTLVTPLQLLLFASKKVQSDGQIVLVDDWYGPSEGVLGSVLESISRVAGVIGYL